MYVNIIIYSNKLLLFVWSTLKKEKKKKKDLLKGPFSEFFIHYPHK